MGDPEKNWFTQKLEFYFFGEKKKRSFCPKNVARLEDMHAEQLNELCTSRL